MKVKLVTPFLFFFFFFLAIPQMEKLAGLWLACLLGEGKELVWDFLYIYISSTSAFWEGEGKAEEQERAACGLESLSRVTELSSTIPKPRQPGTEADVTSSILGSLIMGWSIPRQACWQQTTYTCVLVSAKVELISSQ